MKMQHELTKEELEAQIGYKERQLEDDLETTSSDVRDRLGFHLKVTLPLSLVALSGVGLTIHQLRVRRARAEAQVHNNPPHAVVTLAQAFAQVLPRLHRGSLLVGALLFGAGALLGRRTRRGY